MALILHLTDLHLGPVDEKQIVDDYKSDIIPLSDRTTRMSLLGTTLKSISRYLSHFDQVIDSIVITGDITVGGNKAGYEMFDSLLSKLGKQLPPPNRIVITPGNHDVKWETLSSSPERYELFLNYIRSRGYLTPLLDGIDLREGNSKVNYKNHILSLDSGKVQIIPINSSNYCGVMFPLTHFTEHEWRSIPSLTRHKDHDLLSKELKNLRLFDIPRISHSQLATLSDTIKAATQDKDIFDDEDVIRIGLLHHHLAPVSTSEEVKAFEGITNLGLLRQFLRAHSFNILLHGHKHTSSVYWDSIYDYDRSLSEPNSHHKILVISGSTIKGEDFRRSETCRLINIEPGLAPQLEVIPVHAIDSGCEFVPTKKTKYWLWDNEHTTTSSTRGTKVICADSIDSAYDRIMSVFKGLSQNIILNNFVCEVANIPKKVLIPRNYPEVKDKSGLKSQAWFDDLVTWWQRKKTILRNQVTFTHGERIYSHGHKKINQVELAAKTLLEKRKTSRAIIFLFNPAIDITDNREHKSPHFCLVQMAVTEDSKNNLKLDCLAFFRKQEMRYWWPVNVAEIAILQDKVIKRVKKVYKGIMPGSITTVSTMAYASQYCPKVVVPIVDRLLDEDPDVLWQLAYALFWTQMPQRDVLRNKWEQILDDLIPDDNPDPDGVPVATLGLDNLRSEIFKFSRFHNNNKVNEIEQHLKYLFRINKEYERQTRVDLPTQETHLKWRQEVLTIVNQIKLLLDNLWPE